MENPFQAPISENGATASRIDDRPIGLCPKCHSRTGKIDIVGSYVFGLPVRCRHCKEHFRITGQRPEFVREILTSELLASSLTMLIILTSVANFRSASVACVFFVSWTLNPLLSVIFQYRRDQLTGGLRREQIAQRLHAKFRTSAMFLTCQALRCYFCIAIGFHSWGLYEARYWITPLLQGQFQQMFLYFALPLSIGFILLYGFASTARLAFERNQRTERVLFHWLCLASIAFIAEVEILPPFMTVFGPPGSNHLWCNWWPYHAIPPLPLAERVAWTVSFLVLAGLLLWIMSRWSWNQATQSHECIEKSGASIMEHLS